jgi:serine/threonine protein kinase
MPIPEGTQLGPYQIHSLLGAGGMGEVYKATDTRLNRTVAIKTLPEHLSGTPDRRQRFEREARAVSSLNHPHICALYDIGSQNGADYIVMEYLEGQTLAERLLNGPLPKIELLRSGMQIADALYKAHEQGIVHRDLKPANVFLTKNGVKLLDFGLAKLQQAASAIPSGVSALPTKNAILLKKEPFSERFSIWRRNSWRAGTPIIEPTSLRWEWCSMKWQPA